MSKELATHPDLWVRHCGKHQHTPETFSWSCPQLDDDVQGQYLEFVDLADRRAYYIVVLKHEGTKDMPQPIGRLESVTKM